MPKSARRHSFVAIALLVALLLAGCGSEAGSPKASVSTPAQTSTAPCPVGVQRCITTDPHVQTTGSPVLAINLTQLMKRNQRNLRHVVATCPDSHAFPIHCRFTAMDTTPHHQGPVTGTATISGVFTGTHTYVYQLIYAPNNPAG